MLIARLSYQLYELCRVIKLLLLVYPYYSSFNCSTMSNIQARQVGQNATGSIPKLPTVPPSAYSSKSQLHTEQLYRFSIYWSMSLFLCLRFRSITLVLSFSTLCPNGKSRSNKFFMRLCQGFGCCGRL